MFKLLTFISLVFSFALNALTTSVIIPCHYKHVQYLPRLLQLYDEQTKTPDEVVISISEADKLPPEEINALTNQSHAYALQILTTHEFKGAADNRNIACANAKGDIIICQDADDLPHLQRVEIVKYLFEKHDINLLMHGWIPDTQDFKVYKAHELHLTHITQRNFEQFHAHNGNVAMRREIPQKIKWNDTPAADEDIHFNRAVIKKEGKVFIINADLVIYRWVLSACAERREAYERSLKR